MLSSIVPTFNCAPHLRASLDSLVNQQCDEPFEIIVVNDGSTDYTSEVLAEYRERIQVINLPENKGVTNARNVGLDLAQGDKIISPDADCVYEPNYLQLMSQAVGDGKAQIAYCNWEHHRTEGLHRWVYDNGSMQPYRLFWTITCIGYPALMFDRRALAGYKLGKAEWIHPRGVEREIDRELLTALILDGLRAEHVPHTLFKTGDREGGLDAQVKRDRGRGMRQLAAYRRRWATTDCFLGIAEPGIHADIIIPGHNMPEYTLPCVQSFIDYCGVPFMLFYVDNGSTDDTADRVETLCKENKIDHRIIRLPTNQGFTAAMNIGVTFGEGQAVWLGNNDTLLGPECVEKLWRRLTPGVAAVGAITDDGGSNSILHHQTVMSRFGRTVEDVQSIPVEDIAWSMRGDNRVAPAKMIAFNSALVPRKILEEIKADQKDESYFDTAFHSGLAGDDYWCWQARKRGYRIVRSLDAFVRHYGSRSFRALQIDRRALQHEAYQVLKAKTA